MRYAPTLAAVLAGLALCGPAAAETLNIYSARHYQTDEALYSDFTKQTGITLNRIDGKEDELIERMKKEGANSPADLMITVDAGRLWRAEQAGLFQGIRSKILESRVPAHLRHPDGKWFGFSTRARVIVIDKTQADVAAIRSYEDLAEPRLKGKVCIRSSGNIYNLSLMASMIHHLGEAKALAWAQGVVGNFARDPQGGDTDQIKAIAAGECGFGLSNSYYWLRLKRSSKPDEVAIADRVAVIFPNQDGRGAHVNVSGAGVAAHAKNKNAAIKFLEYLTSDAAQGYFADGNNEYPVVAGIKTAAREILGDFKADTLGVEVLGKNQPAAQKLYDRAGWK